MTKTHPALEALRKTAEGADGFGGEATLVWACQRAREARTVLPLLEALLSERDPTPDELRAAVAAHALPRFSIADPVTGETVQLLEKREIAHANTRAAVDLMTHLGVVMQEIVDQLHEDAVLDATSGPEGALLLYSIRETLAGALSDDQAVRAAFLEHFPHLCRKPDRPAGFPQPSSKDAGERGDAAAEERGDFRHEAPGVDFAELDKTRALEAQARKAETETDG